MLIQVFSIIQAVATLTSGIIVGMFFIWKVGLVGLGMFCRLPHGLFIDADAWSACVPFILSSGYFRLVGYPNILCS
jgi:hypothetical protein